MTIRFFTGDYKFLSNFHPSILCYDGIMYPTSEHAYQASKTNNRSDKLIISAIHTPGQAKKLGRRMEIRSDWNDVKLDVMKEILIIKFNDPVLKLLLLSTEDDELIEGNTWGDTFWGVCRSVGENHLGLILMDIREEMTNA